MRSLGVISNKKLLESKRITGEIKEKNTQQTTAAILSDRINGKEILVSRPTVACRSIHTPRNFPYFVTLYYLL